MTENTQAHLRLVPDPQAREAWRLSLIIAALASIMKHDDCTVLQAACRARYLDLTDGKPIE